PTTAPAWSSPPATRQTTTNPWPPGSSRRCCRNCKRGRDVSRADANTWVAIAVLLVLAFLVRKRRAPATAAPPTAPPDAVMRIGPADWLTLQQAFSSVFIVGQAGSSKTTAIAAQFATGALAHPSKPAVVVFCHKPDEADRFIGYAKACGRESDVIRM